MVVSVRLNVYAWVRCALTFYCRICSCCVFCYFWFLVWFGIRSITTRKYSDAKKSIKSPCTFRLVHKTVLRVYYFGFGLLPYLFRSPFLSLYVYTQHINKSVYIVSVCLCVCVCLRLLFISHHRETSECGGLRATITILFRHIFFFEKC